jgi:hypothetical protein
MSNNEQLSPHDTSGNPVTPNAQPPEWQQPGWASPTPQPSPAQQPGSAPVGSPQPTSPGNFPQPGSGAPVNPGNSYGESVTPPSFPQPGYTAPTGFPQQSGYPPQPGYPPQGYPQQGYPQQGFPQQPQPGFPGGSQGPWAQAPKKRRWPKVLLIIFVLLALLIGGCSYLIFKSVRPIVDKGNDFVSALYKGGTEAKALTCADAGISTEYLNQIRNELKAAGWTGQKTLLASGIESATGTLSTAKVSGTLAVTGATRSVELRLQKPSGGWCVSSFPSPGIAIANG